MDSTLSTVSSSLSERDAVSQAVHRPSPAPQADAGASQRREQLQEQQQARLEQQQRAREAHSSAAQQETSAPANRAVRFRLNRETEQFYIQVVDQNTGEIVKQIPPESLIKLAESLRQATGNLLDESA